MKLVDQPREAYQIYDTCENKMNIFINSTLLSDNEWTNERTNEWCKG